MPDSNRSSIFAAGIALIVGFAFAGYILGFGLGEQSGEYQSNTDTYARHAQDEIGRTCAGLDGTAQTKCIVRVVEATNEHNRSESDLKAQRNMAKWALLMLVATVAMAITTAFGVYYVWRTLNITREIGEKQVRANVAYSTYEVIDMSHTSYEADTGIRLVFKNFGASPARELCFDIVNQDELEFRPERMDASYNMPPPTFRDFDPRKVKGGTFLFCGPGAKVKSHYQLIMKQDIITKRGVPRPLPRSFIYIAGWVRYKDDFWQSIADYRFCKFCIIVDCMVPASRLIGDPPSKETINLREHGPNNYSN